MSRNDLTARSKDFAVYLPSMQIGSAQRLASTSAQWQSKPLPNGLEPKDFNFLRSDNRFWTYKYVLASAEKFRGDKKNIVAHRDSSMFIMGDSGGYQIGTGAFSGAQKWHGLDEEKLRDRWRKSEMREEITKWCELNCDYAMTLDIPLWVNRPSTGKKKNMSPFAGCETDTLLELSVDNLNYLCDVRGRWTGGRKTCKYLNVLQGESEEEEERWFNAVKGFKLDGWSLAGKVGVNGGPRRIFRRILTLADMGLLDRGYDWVHLLMLGKLRWAPVVTALQIALRKQVNEAVTISYDSSSAYIAGGKFETYYSSIDLTDDIRTWTHKSDKFPTTWGFGNSRNPMRLDETHCSGPHKCVMCRNGKEHLPLAINSPIAKLMTVQDMFVNTGTHATRRIGKLFEETVTNNNVFVLVEGMIRANEAVFGPKPCAPPIIREACDLVEEIVGSEQWAGKLATHAARIEEAVDFSQK